MRRHQVRRLGTFRSLARNSRLLRLWRRPLAVSGLVLISALSVLPVAHGKQRFGFFVPSSRRHDGLAFGDRTVELRTLIIPPSGRDMTTGYRRLSVAAAAIGVVADGASRGQAPRAVHLKTVAAIPPQTG
jgi:hypothetical protein